MHIQRCGTSSSDSVGPSLDLHPCCYVPTNVDYSTPSAALASPPFSPSAAQPPPRHSSAPSLSPPPPMPPPAPPPQLPLSHHQSSSLHILLARTWFLVLVCSPRPLMTPCCSATGALACSAGRPPPSAPPCKVCETHNLLTSGATGPFPPAHTRTCPSHPRYRTHCRPCIFSGLAGVAGSEPTPGGAQAAVERCLALHGPHGPRLALC